MLNIIKKPCGGCPFRKDSMKGWLGGETVERTLDFIEEESDFSCHKTREDGEQESYCRGYLLFTKQKCKMPKYNKKLATVLSEIPFEESLKSNILTQKEFITHHKI